METITLILTIIISLALIGAFIGWWNSNSDPMTDQELYGMSADAYLLKQTLFNRYSLNSIQTEGKGVDRYISYMEHKDGTPLTEEELDDITHNHDLHQDLLSAKLLN